MDGLVGGGRESVTGRYQTRWQLEERCSKSASIKAGLNVCNIGVQPDDFVERPQEKLTGGCEKKTKLSTLPS